MNRLIRVILYITAACVGIGSAALILSLAIGGGKWYFYEDAGFREANNIVRGIVSEVREKVQRNRRNMASAATESDAGDYADGDSDDYSYDDYDADTDYNYAGDELILNLDASEVENLEIDLQHGYLQMYESEDEQIRVSMSGPTHDISVSCESGELVIHDGRQGSKSREDANIYLQVPEDMEFQTVNIQAEAGVLTLDCDFFADRLILSADAGEIFISEAEAAIVTASVGAGTIDMEEGFFGKVKLDCGVGTIDMDADISQDSEISCGMGAVCLELENGADSVNYVLTCGMGSIEIGDNSYTALSREKRIDNGAPATFTLKCGMGQICME